MDWMTVVQNVGFFAVGTGGLSFLIKSLVTNSLNKDLEAYKSKLNTDLEAHKSSLTKDIEAFKSVLQVSAVEHQVRFTKLHDKRAEVIQTLYSKLVALDLAIHSVLKLFHKTGEPSLEEKVREYGRLHNEFNDFYLPNKIFFDAQACKVLDDFLFLSRNTYFDITTYPIDPTSVEYKHGPRELLNERHEYWEKARKVFENDISGLKTQMEIQFRKMLGVES